MRKLFINKKNSGLDTACKQVIREYFNVLGKLDDTHIKAIGSCGDDGCVDLLRYCLCGALGLQTELCFPQLESVAKIVSVHINRAIIESNIASTVSEKDYDLIVQTCMHYVISARNLRRGVKADFSKTVQ